MGIDIYAVWPEKSIEEVKAALDLGATGHGGFAGYLREAYHGGPYPSEYLVREAFDHKNGTEIDAKTLRSRLAETLRLARERMRRVYFLTDDSAIDSEIEQYEVFVAFCELMQSKLESPPTIIASW